MKQYRTSEVAQMMGIHPNTVRFYEEWGLITKPVWEQNDDIISVCDRLLLSLSKAEINAGKIMTILKEMKALYCEEQKMLEI